MTNLNWQDYITSDPTILFGKPVIKGTRIPVQLILEKLSQGGTIADLLLAYPRISEKAIHACLIFGAESLKNE